VGTVHVALARPDGPVDHWRLNLKGTRRFIQQLTATTALNQLRLGLLEARQDRKARP
jgi:nicotinamide mononucleotide (NMN) deamidase PncC